MNIVTLPENSRNVPLVALPDDERRRVWDCLTSTLAVSGNPNADQILQRAGGARVSDLESLIDINYVPQNRDLSKILPIPTESYFVDYDRKTMQPLLEALAVGDFDLAAALTPEKLRLCGYREVKTPYTEEEYAMHGSANQFAHTEIPAGVYPVFAREFQRHEANNCYTNQLKDSYGMLTWLHGQCVKSSYENEDHPFQKTVAKAPYCHQVAKDILNDGKDFQINLIHPFAAKPVYFEDQGKQYVSYQIVDTSLPDLLKDNPINHRNSNMKQGKSLDSIISGAARRSGQQIQTGQPLGREEQR